MALKHKLMCESETFIFEPTGWERNNQSYGESKYIVLTTVKTTV